MRSWGAGNFCPPLAILCLVRAWSQDLRTPPSGTAGKWYDKPNFHTMAPPLGRHLQVCAWSCSLVTIITTTTSATKNDNMRTVQPKEQNANLQSKRRCAKCATKRTGKSATITTTCKRCTAGMGRSCGSSRERLAAPHQRHPASQAAGRPGAHQTHLPGSC
eukprot:364165-Chlamydomonas_euryale.AAC.13